MGGVSLEWFPKPFGPGDIDGQGARRLLGQPSLPHVEMLVREMAQNSWDARLPRHTVEFVLHFRSVSNEEQEYLRTLLLPRDPPGLGLRSSLTKRPLRVLEVHDRGTTGLAGPIRNDRAVPDGTPTDFIDFVFTTGAPRDTHLGGGTYGFGKTIAYTISRPGTVLIHSRTAEGDTRFIASAVGDSFDLDGQRYTGRHWWGLTPTADRVEPLMGADANLSAGRVFSDLPDEHDSGTSLMILDPDLGDEPTEAIGRRFSEAMLWHLWPKLVPEDPHFPAMNLRLLVEDEPIPLRDPWDHPILKGHAESLAAVRATQKDREWRGRYHTTVSEIRSLKPDKLLGHLGMTWYDAPRASDYHERHDVEHVAEADEARPIDDRSHHITLMRNEAELVVRYDEGQPLDSAVLQWAGVFKPVDAVDDSFAASEPPAHDDWVPAALQDKRAARDVRVALRRVRETVSAQLRPEVDGDHQASEHSAARLGDSLASLAMSSQASRPTGEPASSRGQAGGIRPLQARLVGTAKLNSTEGWVRHEALFELSCRASGGVDVQPNASVAYDGGREPDSTACYALGFREEGGHAIIPSLQLASMQEGRWWVVVESAADLAIEIDLTVSEIQTPQ